MSFLQTTIKGKVTNKFNLPISNVNILINSKNNPDYFVLDATDTLGNFSIDLLNVGVNKLLFTSFGYLSDTIIINVLSGKNEINRNIFLLTRDVELQEVIINKNTNFTIKEDTIIYNAKKYLKGNENVVEDLLKNIPGISVSSEGVIMVGNQEVEKIMVEGDDFFEKGYKILTKSMPSSPIDKVEVIRNVSENKLLKGIENSNKIVLNLKLDDEVKRKWFGNLSASNGLISLDRYKISSNLMNFGVKNKFYFLSDINNIGDDATGNIEYLIKNHESKTYENEEVKSSSLIHFSTIIPSLGAKKYNFNKTKFSSLSSIFNLPKGGKLSILGYFDSESYDFNNSSLSKYNIGVYNFENQQLNFLNKKSNNFYLKTTLFKEIFKNQNLLISLVCNKNQNFDQNNQTFNFLPIIENLNGQNVFIENKIKYTVKINEKKALIFNFILTNDLNKQNYNINRFLYNDLFLIDSVSNVLQTVHSNKIYSKIEMNFINRISIKQLFEFKIINQNTIDNLTSNFQLYNENKNKLKDSNFYLNNIVYKVNDLALNVKYSFSINKILLFTDINTSFYLNKLINVNKSLNQNPFFIIPKIGVNWKINNNNKLLVSYSYNVKNSTINEVYNNYINTSFRSFQRGTGVINQVASSTFLTNYTYGGWGQKTFLNCLFIFTKDYDFFGTNTILNQNYFQTSSLIIKDRTNALFSLSYNRYLKIIKSSIKFNFNSSSSHFKNIINNSNLLDVISNSQTYGVELRSGFRGFFNYHFGSILSINEVQRTSLNKVANNNIFLDFLFVIKNKLNIDLKTETYFFGGNVNNSKYFFLDLEADYILKTNKYILSLIGKNLTNNRYFINNSVSETNVTTFKYRLLPIYLLLKFEWKF